MGDAVLGVSAVSGGASGVNLSDVTSGDFASQAQLDTASDAMTQAVTAALSIHGAPSEVLSAKSEMVGVEQGDVAQERNDILSESLDDSNATSDNASEDMDAMIEKVKNLYANTMNYNIIWRTAMHTQKEISQLLKGS